MSPCYRTLWLGTDEQGCPLVTLSSSSHRNGVCIHVSVTDVIRKTFPAVKDCKCLCSGSRFSSGRAVTGSGYFQPVQTCRYQSIRKIFLGLPAVVGLLPSHGTYYVVGYRVGGWAHPVTEVQLAILGSWKVVVPSQLLFPITITLEGRILTRGAPKAFLLGDMWVLTLLVLISSRIGNLPAQLSTLVIVLPT